MGQDYTLTIEEFLTARFDDAEQLLVRYSESVNDVKRNIEQILALRKILAWHANWPVMVTGPDNVEVVNDSATSPSTLDQVRIRMINQVDFMTKQQYIASFGTEAPTAPILKILAYAYRDHPDYQERWLP